jgi:hypothetical protein
LIGPGYLDLDILRLLLARAPDLEITLEMVKKANKLGNFELLAQHGSCIEITADVVESFLDPLELSDPGHELCNISERVGVDSSSVFASGEALISRR